MGSSRWNRLSLLGGSAIKQEPVARFCEYFGEAIYKLKDVVLVHGGSKARVWPDGRRYDAADWLVVQGLCSRMGDFPTDQEVSSRVSTRLPDPNRDTDRTRKSKVLRFEQDDFVGESRTLPLSRQGRRYRLVDEGDVLVTLAGSTGTEEMIELATALERPVLPLPFTGGSSRDWWVSEQRHIVQQFSLEGRDAELEKIDLAKMSQDQIRRLASRIAVLLRRRMRRSCFVIMPFHRDFETLYSMVIKPAIEAVGLSAYRTDKQARVGDVVQEIRREIRRASCVVAILTGSRPNVMWELGWADALGRDAVLLHAEVSNKERELPFDLKTRKILFYDQGLSANERRTLGEKIQDSLRDIVS